MAFSDIDTYISTFPEQTQSLLSQVRQAIREAAPEAVEVISYQMPTFKLGRNLVHFAAYEKHIGFYPGADGIATFQDRFGKYKWAKGSVQFPIDEPMPIELIQAITHHRVEVEKARMQSKKK